MTLSLKVCGVFAASFAKNKPILSDIGASGKISFKARVAIETNIQFVSENGAPVAADTMTSAARSSHSASQPSQGKKYN